MSSVSIFAFIDKEGIVTESQKYVDEIVILDKRGDKQLIDLNHNSLQKEDKIYEFEKKETHSKHIDTLKALGLAMFFTNNPRPEDNYEQIQEMFCTDQLKIDEDDNAEIIDNKQVFDILKHETGFQF